MVIGIHAVAAYRPHPTGVERYAVELLEAIANLSDADAHRFLLYTATSAERAFPSPFFEERRLAFPLLWTQARLSWEMLFRPPDVLFSPAQALPRVLPLRGAVTTIHGVEFLRKPDAYSPMRRRYLHFVTRDAARRSKRVIVPSRATKQDLFRYYRTPPEKIFVIPHGVPRASAVKNEGGAMQTANPYFLFLGRIELLKNVDGIVRAFTMARERYGAEFPKLVLAGSFGFGGERIARLIRESAARDAIALRGYVAENEKRDLLKNATALLLPSHAEGFGFPILEAQASRVPVITSTGTATEEVAGDGALLIRAGDDDALAGAMVEMAGSSALRAALIARGEKNVGRFSWTQSAASTMDILTRW